MSNIEVIKNDVITIDQAFIQNRPLSYSSLKAFRKSPKHYVEYLTKPFVQTDAQILGSLIECLLLEKEKFKTRYQVFVKATGTGSVAKNRESYELASRNKKTLITAEMLKSAEYAVESIMSVDMSKQIIEGISKTQIRLSWTDKKRNLPLIGYVDFESNVWGEMFAVDLKTTGTSADPDDIAKQIIQWEYNLQTGTYLTGYHQAKYKFPYFIFLFVETKSPYNVSVNFCDTKFCEQAKKEFDGTLTAFRYCMDKNKFHEGYEFRLAEAMDYFSLQMPRWYKPKFEV